MEIRWTGLALKGIKKLEEADIKSNPWWKIWKPRIEKTCKEVLRAEVSIYLEVVGEELIEGKIYSSPIGVLRVEEIYRYNDNELKKPSERQYSVTCIREDNGMISLLPGMKIILQNVKKVSMDIPEGTF